MLSLRLISYVHYDDGGHHYTYAFCAIELLGMGNAKAALESKAATAVVLIRATTSREWRTLRTLSTPSSTDRSQPLPLYHIRGFYQWFGWEVYSRSSLRT